MRTLGSCPRAVESILKFILSAFLNFVASDSVISFKLNFTLDPMSSLKFVIFTSSSFWFNPQPFAQRLQLCRKLPYRFLTRLFRRGAADADLARMTLLSLVLPLQLLQLVTVRSLQLVQTLEVLDV